jgi:outer membrane immunogenic protein
MRLKALLIVGVSLCATLACSHATAQHTAAPLEIGLDYNYVHTNAPPAGCGCFSMQGGDGSAFWAVSPRFEPMLKVTTTSASAINGTSSNLRLTSYLFGARSAYHVNRLFAPFGEVALGVSHASGTLVSPGSGAATNVFAATVGGGLLLDLTPRIAIKAAQADWYLTQVPNGINGHQNNVLLSAGVVFRLGPTKSR